MFRHIGKLSAHENLILRLALAFTFLWSGLSSLYSPENWIGFVPDWIELFIAKDIFLTVHSVAEISLGIGFLIGLWTPIFSLIAFLALISILIIAGIDDITFRDVGLVALALVLFLRSLKRV
ncbi:MAG TPA: DoxX family membrane protein [Candidatus Paceibacterota bacterium]